MRRMSYSFAAVALMSTVALLQGGCPKPIDPVTPVDEARAAAEKKRAALTEKRPPFPNMAGPGWGKTVVEREAAKADEKLAGEGRDAAFAVVKRELHSREDGSEARMVKAAAALWRSAMDDGDRALGASLMGAGLVLDPTVNGYRERLIDAAGLAAYAANLRGGTVLAQSAQALILIAAGRNHMGKQLLDIISNNDELAKKLDGDASLLLANTRFLLGARDDDFFRDVARTISDNPISVRARALKARALLDLGFGVRALEVSMSSDRTTPYLEAIGAAGQGTVEKHRDTAIERLMVLQKKVREPERGEPLYWLGTLLAAAPGREQEAEAIAGELAARNGFRSEADVIRAHLALRRGDGKAAFDLANNIVTKTGASPSVAIDALWLVVDSCALMGDVDCVRRRGTNAIGADGNRARYAHALAALEILGKVDPNSVTPPLNKDESLRLAHRLSPFDPQLAARVGDEVSTGGDALAGQVRAARRAMVNNARVVATEALAGDIPDDCRVCRGLRAVANPDAAAGARNALLAIRGKGPPLAEDDLVAVIDVLGALPIDGSEDVLLALSKDPRKSVKDAVKRAQADLKNPEGRKAREATKDHAHDDDAPKAGPEGGMPVPH